MPTGAKWFSSVPVDPEGLQTDSEPKCQSCALRFPNPDTRRDEPVAREGRGRGSGWGARMTEQCKQAARAGPTASRRRRAIPWVGGDAPRVSGPALRRSLGVRGLSSVKESPRFADLCGEKETGTWVSNSLHSLLGSMRFGEVSRPRWFLVRLRSLWPTTIRSEIRPWRRPSTPPPSP